MRLGFNEVCLLWSDQWLTDRNPLTVCYDHLNAQPLMGEETKADGGKYLINRKKKIDCFLNQILKWIDLILSSLL